MTAAISGTPEKITSARFVARLTDAETTPGVARIAFSTRSTQDSQAMPSTRMLKVAGFFGSGEREDIDVFLYRRRSQYAALWIADYGALSENNAGGLRESV